MLLWPFENGSIRQYCYWAILAVLQSYESRDPERQKNAISNLTPRELCCFASAVLQSIELLYGNREVLLACYFAVLWSYQI